MIEVKPLSDNEILTEIVSIVIRHLPEATIYLFGSRASGRAKPTSLR